MSSRSLRLGLLLVTAFTAPGVAQQIAPPPRFDAYVAQVLAAFTVPGVAVVIGKDGKVVLAKGYGVRIPATPLAKWVMVQLDSGRVADGSRSFAPTSTMQIWRDKMLEHTGGLPGYVSKVAPAVDFSFDFQDLNLYPVKQ